MIPSVVQVQFRTEFGHDRIFTQATRKKGQLLLTSISTTTYNTANMVPRIPGVAVRPPPTKSGDKRTEKRASHQPLEMVSTLETAEVRPRLTSASSGPVEAIVKEQGRQEFLPC
jgi:hypothetical protein